MPDPRNHMDSGHTYVRGYARRKRRQQDPSSSIVTFIIIIAAITAIIWFIKTFWILVTILAVIAIFIYITLKWNKWKLIPLALVAIALVASLSLYVSEKEPSTTVEKPIPINLVKATKSNSGLGTFEATIQIVPTQFTEPGQLYSFVLENQITELEYLASWEQLELDISKTKSFTIKLTPDEHSAWNMYPNFNIVVYKMLPKHDVLYLISSLVLFFGLIALIFFLFIKPKQSYAISESIVDNYYTIQRDCKNCHRTNDVTIRKGKSIIEERPTFICSKCGYKNIIER